MKLVKRVARRPIVAPVAQRKEHRPFKPTVAGLTPAGRTTWRTERPTRPGRYVIKREGQEKIEGIVEERMEPVLYFVAKTTRKQRGGAIRVQDMTSRWSWLELDAIESGKEAKNP